MPAEDIEGMLNAVTVNPDDPHFACPPDGMKGTSTITHQKIVKNLKMPGGQVSDVWVVQWDCEPLDTTGNTVANYLWASYPVDDPNYVCGELNNPDLGWDTAGFIRSLEVGGLCVYYMPPGTSPFPASDGTGPREPILVERLLFGKDVFHDLTRLLGANYEIIDTTNNLSQQGNCYQGGWEANQQNNQPFYKFGPVSATDTQLQTLIGRVGSCPPGSVANLVKTAENRMAAAKEGTFVMSRIDYSDNRPSSGYGGVTEVYESISNHPAAGGRQLFLVLTNQPILIKPTDGDVTLSRNVTQSRPVYMTAAQLNVTVFTGLNALYAATISREVVTQAFTNPDSQYIAFAKRNNAITDTSTVDVLTNVMCEIPMFHPSKSNKTGKFARMAKALWKKAAPMVKPIAGIAASQLIGYPPQDVRKVTGGVNEIVDELTRVYQSKTNNPNGFSKSLPEDFAAISAAYEAGKSAVKKAKAKKKGGGPSSKSG